MSENQTNLKTLKIHIQELLKNIEINKDKKEEENEKQQESTKFDILQIENLLENLTPENFHSFKNYLNDGGKLILLFTQNYKNENNSIMKNVSNMKFAGYIDTKVETEENLFKISGKKRKNNKSKTENPFKKIDLEAKSELVLEDELIDPFDNYQKFSKKSDCVTKPKPCKGCNCGRAATENGSNDNVPMQTSSCGRCYLGDAFRCAGCPYKGKPAFEPGDKIDFNDINKIPNGNLINENQILESEVITIKNEFNGKVKIDL